MAKDDKKIKEQKAWKAPQDWYDDNVKGPGPYSLQIIISVVKPAKGEQTFNIWARADFVPRTHEEPDPEEGYPSPQLGIPNLPPPGYEEVPL